MAIELWITMDNGEVRKYRTNVLHLKQGSVVLTNDVGSTGVVPINTAGTPRSLFVTFDGQPDTELGPDHMGKVLPLGFAGKILGARLTADIDCDAVVTVWRDSISNGDPTAADNIVGTPLALSASRFYEDFTLAGWNVDFNPDDVWVFTIDTIDVGVKFLQVQLLIGVA